MQIPKDFTSCKGSKVVPIWALMQREPHRQHNFWFLLLIYVQKQVCVSISVIVRPEGS